MPAYDAVLLDLYDTLVWSDWRSWQRRVAERIGVAPETMAAAFDETRPARSVGAFPDAAAELGASIRAAGVEPDPELVAEIAASERAGLQDQIRPYDDSMRTVAGLRERGVPTVLVSNCSHDTRFVVERLGLEEAFDAVVLSFEVGSVKPQPAIYHEALARVGSPEPQRSVFVDDQVAYCDGAAALGLQTFLILRPEESLEGRPASTNGHRVIETLEPLLD
jgi:HAD superfamily hydrolase (TIGR01509 family)